MTVADTFDQIVSKDLHEPLIRLCTQLASEGAADEHSYFNQTVSYTHLTLPTKA